MPPAPAASTAPPGAPIRVVIVEDDAAIRETLAQWIEAGDGFACVGQFPDGETAIARLAEAAPDVALVDINLPGLSGIECVRALKQKRPHTQFVMLTVYEDSTHIFDALAAGATGYLLKRATREDLLAAVRDVQAGGSPMSSSIARKVVQSLHRRPPHAVAPEGLSKRESEVLALLAEGYLYKEIADALGVALPTVNSFIRRIYEKLHVHSRGQAVALYTDARRR